MQKDAQGPRQKGITRACRDCWAVAAPLLVLSSLGAGSASAAVRLCTPSCRGDARRPRYIQKIPIIKFMQLKIGTKSESIHGSAQLPGCRQPGCPSTGQVWCLMVAPAQSPAASITTSRTTSSFPCLYPAQGTKKSHSWTPLQHFCAWLRLLLESRSNLRWVGDFWERKSLARCNH